MLASFFSRSSSLDYILSLMNKVVIDQGLGWSLITWILLRLIRTT